MVVLRITGCVPDEVGVVGVVGVETAMGGMAGGAIYALSV
jgi:hypothetical protein